MRRRHDRPGARDGELFIEVICLLLDPTSRICMSVTEPYIPPAAIGAAKRGFIVTEFAHCFPEAMLALGGCTAPAQLRTRQDIRTGHDWAGPEVKLLYTGDNFGKLPVEVCAP